MSTPTAEGTRLEQDRLGLEPWKRWGPYVSERSWGTVREDYTPVHHPPNFRGACHEPASPILARPLNSRPTWGLKLIQITSRLSGVQAQQLASEKLASVMVYPSGVVQAAAGEDLQPI